MIDILEIRRQIMHVLVGIIFMAIIILAPYGEMFLFAVFILGCILSFLSTQFKVPVISKALCLFERNCNKSFPGKGVLYFFLGSLLSLQLFTKDIALASIAILTFSDPISHFIGSSFGKIPSSLNRRKKIEGTLAGILTGTLFASFFIQVPLAFLASLVAMLAELAGMKMGNNEIDDNLLIPLAAGTTVFLILKFIV